MTRICGIITILTATLTSAAEAPKEQHAPHSAQQHRTDDNNPDRYGLFHRD